MQELYFFLQILEEENWKNFANAKIKAFLISDFGLYLWGIICGLQSV